MSAIDAIKEKKILKHLKEETKDKTSVIISHRVATIKDAENIIVLKKGQIIEQGNHKQLLSKKGYYYSVNKNQNNAI